MALFKKTKKAPASQIQIQQLSSKPYEQLASLQKRVDVLQSFQIQLNTHVGETELNALGEIKRIQLLMDRIKNDMHLVKHRIERISVNMEEMIVQLNLTSKDDDIQKFKFDMERMQPFNFMTVIQFEKLVKDIVDEKFGE